MARTYLSRAVVTFGLLGLAALCPGATARASDDCVSTCTYVTVTEYVYREVPYARVVTLYDDCGRPYRVEVSGTRKVRCAVTRRVAFCD